MPDDDSLQAKEEELRVYLFIRALCKTLELPCNTCGHALFYFQEFIAYGEEEDNESEDSSTGEEGIQKIDWNLMAMAAVFMAAKATENPRKVRAVIVSSVILLNHVPESGIDSLESSCPTLGPDYWSLKDSVHVCELILARIISFDFYIDLPYIYIVDFVEHILQERFIRDRKLFPELDDFYSFQWDVLEDCVIFANSCMVNRTVFLEYKASEIAAASVWIGLKLDNCHSQDYYLSFEQFCKVLHVSAKMTDEIFKHQSEFSRLHLHQPPSLE